MWNRQEFKFRGKEAFKRNYGSAVAVALLMGIVTLLFGSNSGVNTTVNENRYVEYSSGVHYSTNVPIIGALIGGIAITAVLIGILLQIFIENVLEVGGKRFFILNQTSRPGISTIIDIFKSGNYGNVVLVMFLQELFVALWSLLLVVPGIIKHYEYLMIPYILAENPGMDRQEVFKISKQMMDGHKMDAFVMDLSFIGWYLLSACTCGLLNIFYVNPYREAAFAEVYAFNKQKAFEAGYIR